jgi:hypothetical protein
MWLEFLLFKRENLIKLIDQKDMCPLEAVENVRKKLLLDAA